MDEQTYECERCGHAYTETYGAWYVNWLATRWYCHSCAPEHDPWSGPEPYEPNPYDGTYSEE